MALAGMWGGKRKPSNAEIAKNRLKVIVELDQRHCQNPEFLPMLERDIMHVISKYVKDADSDSFSIQMEHRDHEHILRVNINLPKNP
jgi:cell division topological specificity factor